MYLHNYLFLQKVERDGQFIHEGRSFHILIPVEGNESAVNAMSNAKSAMAQRFKEISLNIPLYDFEYLGTQKADNFQESVIKNKKFVIIPRNDSGIQTKLD